MITVVDYGRGNLFSIGQALSHLGADYVISSERSAVDGADRLILPGVGAFGDAMASLARLGLVDPIRRAAARGLPILGICLGMQLLAESSEEFGSYQGLGIVPGRVRSLPKGSGPGCVRIPNVGWHPLTVHRNNPMLADLADGGMVYFVHSYAFEPADAADIAASITVNGRQVTASLQRGAVGGHQFHPEKSGPVGLDLLRRFLAA